MTRSGGLLFSSSIGVASEDLVKEPKPYWKYCLLIFSVALVIFMVYCAICPSIQDQDLMRRSMETVLADINEMRAEKGLDKLVPVGDAYLSRPIITTSIKYNDEITDDQVKAWLGDKCCRPDLYYVQISTRRYLFSWNEQYIMHVTFA